MRAGAAKAWRGDGAARRPQEGVCTGGRLATVTGPQEQIPAQRGPSPPFRTVARFRPLEATLTGQFILSASHCLPSVWAPSQALGKQGLQDTASDLRGRSLAGEAARARGWAVPTPAHREQLCWGNSSPTRPPGPVCSLATCRLRVEAVAMGLGWVETSKLGKCVWSLAFAEGSFHKCTRGSQHPWPASCAPQT